LRKVGGADIRAVPLSRHHTGAGQRLEAGCDGSCGVQVTLSLQNSDILMHPPVAEVNKVLGRLVRSLVDSTKPFIRWMDGTCIETPEQRVRGEDEEPVVFTFYWDTAANPQVRLLPASTGWTWRQAGVAQHELSTKVQGQYVCC
jgi:hypothetical protein